MIKMKLYRENPYDSKRIFECSSYYGDGRITKRIINRMMKQIEYVAGLGYEHKRLSGVINVDGVNVITVTAYTYVHFSKIITYVKLNGIDYKAIILAE